MFSRRNENVRVVVSTGVFVLLTTYIGLLSDLGYLEFLGLFFSLAICSWVAYSFLIVLWDSWLGVLCKKNVDFKALGSWAVITGATDGIGLAFAKKLAKRKINIVLISRNEDKLKSCAKEIESTYGVLTRIIQVDFSRSMDTYEYKVESALAGLDIGTLINNVGMTYRAPSYFHEISQQSQWISEMININVGATSVMTKIVLPQMVERQKGAVINIGSMTSLHGTPFFSMYAATKCFMQSLTQDLEYEYEGSGITFQYQATGYVHTKIAKLKHMSSLIPTPDQYAAVALRSVGLQQNSMVWPPLRLLQFSISVIEATNPKFCRRLMGSAMYTFWLYAKQKEINRMKEFASIA